MSDVQEWLGALGLGQYAGVFEENAVDEEVLGDLTDEDLEKIGVKLGHRKKLLKAIAGLKGTGLRQTTAGAGVEPPRTADAERRQLTVMFCDLVGSTELSQTLDPEELREINRAYQDAAKVSVEKYGGYVARYMGDGVLAYFGYPLAHEDDAERAVRAGLDLAGIVPNLNTNLQLAVRTGIATGSVVVGDLIGEGASQESAVVGETPNLAARLQGEAAANTVMISDATRALVAGMFECSELGARRLKGFAAEQTLWRVPAERRSESRFEALRSKSLTSFVGREGEFGLLLNRWESAVGGEGQVVLIEGEPGIGKSRIADELRHASNPRPQATIRYLCSPHHTNSAFYPFIAQMENVSNAVPGDSQDEGLDKLERVIPASTPERSKALWLLAKLLALPTARYPTLTLGPQEVKAETIAALRVQLAVLCDAGPVLVVFEDAHWIDPTSFEVLDVLVQAGRDLPVLIVVTHCPEFEPPWGSYGYVTRLQRNRLPRRDVTTIIKETSKGRSLPDEIVQQILTETVYS